MEHAGAGDVALKNFRKIADQATEDMIERGRKGPTPEEIKEIRRNVAEEFERKSKEGTLSLLTWKDNHQLPMI